MGILKQMDSKKYILGLGNPIIDISAEADQATLDKYELVAGQTIFCSDKNMPFYDYLEGKPEVTYIPGGSVTNSIRVTNWLLQNSEKFGCSLLGCIGKDNYGSKISENLQKVNVKPLLEVKEDILSSRCGVGICQKERCLVPQIRASTMLSMDFVDANMADINKAELLLVEGYFVIEKFDIVKSLVAKFNESKKKVAFTLSATFMIDNFLDKLLEVSNCADVIFCNEDEAMAFSKVKSSNMVEVAEACHKVLTPRDRIIVVTCGSEPVVVSEMKNGEVKSITQAAEKLSEAEITDTNGCGDSFVGGFLSQYIQGEDLARSAKAGIFASTVIIKNNGCTWDINTPIKF